MGWLISYFHKLTACPGSVCYQTRIGFGKSMGAEDYQLWPEMLPVIVVAGAQVKESEQGVIVLGEHRQGHWLR